MDSDAELKRWYAQYRRKYFTNKLPLPKEVDVYYAVMPGLHAECDDNDMPHNGEFDIRIDIRWKDVPEVARLWLLHEMTHAHLWPYCDHGVPFQKEILRLVQAGAYKKIL
jgi:hypothetical protein